MGIYDDVRGRELQTLATTRCTTKPVAVAAAKMVARDGMIAAQLNEAAERVDAMLSFLKSFAQTPPIHDVEAIWKSVAVFTKPRSANAAVLMEKAVDDTLFNKYTHLVLTRLASRKAYADGVAALGLLYCADVMADSACCKSAVLERVAYGFPATAASNGANNGSMVVWEVLASVDPSLMEQAFAQEFVDLHAVLQLTEMEGSLLQIAFCTSKDAIIKLQTSTCLLGTVARSKFGRQQLDHNACSSEDGCTRRGNLRECHTRV